MEVDLIMPHTYIHTYFQVSRATVDEKDKSQRLGRTQTKLYLLEMTGPWHSWNHTRCGCLPHHIGSASCLSWSGKGFIGPTSYYLWAVAGFWERKTQFSLWVWFLVSQVTPVDGPAPASINWSIWVIKKKKKDTKLWVSQWDGSGRS